ncbi:MAG TPA: hypothetical protein VGU43_02785 [Thermoplasmata archaeon]|nr:hypothetical protein [Thermoplasmata archaeon]
MNGRRVRPSSLTGQIVAPASKSYTHRAAVVAALSERSVTVERPLESEDTQATLRGLARMGTPVVASALRWSFGGAGLLDSRRGADVDCRSSGTTLRFLLSVAALRRVPTRFRCSRQLARRPTQPLIACLRQRGARIRRVGSMHLSVTGPLTAGRFFLDASESSQFLSSLLLVLPRLDGPSTIVVTGRLPSRPYVEATEFLLRQARAPIRHGGPRWEIPAPSPYSLRRIRVPGDASSAAPLWVGGALPGGDVAVSGLELRWPQADLEVLALLERAGGEVNRTRSGARVRHGRLRAFTFRFDHCPDLLPLAGVIASFARPGTSRLLGGGQAAQKESDRVHETGRLAQALGARVGQRAGELWIRAGRLPARLSYEPPEDHRVVMAAAVAATGLAETSRLGSAGAVRKSYPGFWADLSTLGARGGP